MKKILLMVFATMLALGSSAEIRYQGMPVAPRGMMKMAKAPARAAEGETASSMWFSYCEPSVAGAIGVGQACYLAGVMKLPAEVAQKYAGSKIEKLEIGLGTPTNDQVVVFFSKNLAEEPEYIQGATVSTDQLSWNTVEIDEPYEIDGTDLYIGYIVKADNANSYPIGVDGYATANTDSDIVGISTSADPTSFEYGHIGSDYGAMSIRALIVGNIPAVSLISSGMYLPNKVSVDTPFNALVSLKNLGTDDITKLDVTYMFDDEIDTKEITLAEPMASGASTEVEIGPFQSSTIGAKSIAFSITAANGVEISPISYSTQVEVTLCKTPRMMVVEEATSVGCGYCPYGIVGMQFMKENFGDQFIGIAAHSTGQGTDEMIITNYNGFSSSLPGCLTNGRPQYVNQNYPSASYLLQAYYQYFYGNIADADVYFEKAQWNCAEKTGVTVKTKTMFGNSSTNADYRIAFVLLENKVGPYKQKNYLAGQPASMNTGDWGQKGSSVETLYDDVARWISNFNGDPNSFPATIVAGDFYENECTVPLEGLTNYYGRSFKVNPENIEVIALVMDGKTRNILNATRIKAEDIEANDDVHAQAIEWDIDTSANYAPGTSIELPTVSNQGLPISYELTAEPEGCATLDGYTLTFNTIGKATVTGTQEGDGNILPALPVTKTLTSRYNQTIEWNQEFTGIQPNVAITLEATATSGLAVSYKFKSYTSKATLKNGTITFKQPVTVTVIASQAGNTEYAPAEPVERTITYDPSGIEAITIDSLPADALFFDLRGVQVNAPKAGNVYIVVNGSDAVKVLVK